MKCIIPFLLVSSMALAGGGTDNTAGDCFPNVTKVDMCEHAQKVSNSWNKDIGLPQPLGTSTLFKVEAEGPVVIQYITMARTEAQMTKDAAANDTTLKALRADWSSIVAESIESSGCDRQLFMAFVGLGGVYQYNYYFPNGDLFTTIQQHHCPQDR